MWAACLALGSLAALHGVGGAATPPPPGGEPNVILFALDGGILPSTWALAYDAVIVASGVRNPNGCRPGMTWFTNCCWHGTDSGDCEVVRQARDAGHELATHTMHHWDDETLPYSYEQWVEEVGGQRDWLAACGVPPSKVTGFRAPHFSINNLLGRVLVDLNFKYDSDLSGQPTTQPGWLNGSYDLAFCQQDAKQRARCGEWHTLPLFEVPAYLLPGSGRRTDPRPVPGMTVLERLKADFTRKRGTGVPVSINVHERYLEDSSNVATLVEFLSWAFEQSGETWAITHQQAMDWRLAPPGTSLSNVTSAALCDAS